VACQNLWAKVAVKGDLYLMNKAVNKEIVGEIFEETNITIYKC